MFDFLFQSGEFLENYLLELLELGLDLLHNLSIHFLGVEGGNFGNEIVNLQLDLGALQFVFELLGY